MRLTEHVHQILGSHLRHGDYAIDATAGNGHDTLFLAQMVGANGSVLAIDLQASAIEATRQRLATVSTQAQIRLEQADHADLLEAEVARRSELAAAIVFNLGYLPGSDKAVQTRPAHTLRALDASARLLHSGGRLCVTAYRAHPGGQDEAQAVENWMCERVSSGWQLESRIPPSKNLPPVLWVATKPPV